MLVVVERGTWRRQRQPSRRTVSLTLAVSCRFLPFPARIWRDRKNRRRRRLASVTLLLSAHLWRARRARPSPTFLMPYSLPFIKSRRSWMEHLTRTLQTYTTWYGHSGPLAFTGCLPSGLRASTEARLVRHVLGMRCATQPLFERLSVKLVHSCLLPGPTLFRLRQPRALRWQVFHGFRQSLMTHQ